MDIHIDAVQYTVGREPVLIQYSFVGQTGGPYAGSRQAGTTQSALSARSGTPGYWSDAEIAAELMAQLAEKSIEANVVN